MCHSNINSHLINVSWCKSQISHSNNNGKHVLGSQGEGEGSNMQKSDTSQSTNPFNDRMEKMRWCRAVDWTRNKYVFRKFSPDKSRQ